MEKIKGFLKFFYNRPVRFTLLSLSVMWVIGFWVSFCKMLLPLEDWIGVGELITCAALGLVGALCVFLPPLLTIYNLVYLIAPKPTTKLYGVQAILESVTMVWGGICLYLVTGLSEVQFDKDWSEQLHNDEVHTPINTENAATIAVLAIIGIVGYLVLRYVKPSKRPPLVTALSIGGLYIGIVLSLLWTVQSAKQNLVFGIWTVNLIFIAFKVLRVTVSDLKQIIPEEPVGKPRIIILFYRLITKAQNWYWLGLLAALPILGVVIGILAVFGQAPDSIIRAWTETSDWTFSQRVAPQNIYYDQHYLCTVAAGGHKEVVHPLREGKRHGHKVLVNRQLCVANAFEQLLQEGMPKTHRAIRRFYDKYGYPIAKHIKSPYVADAVWFLMKPLEWFFLTVLYLFDLKPENRIAVQYPHSTPPKVE